jgi:hypothetical protein
MPINQKKILRGLVIMSELQINEYLVKSGLQSHRWKSMWMNSIHHVLMFDVDVCDIVLELQYISYFKIFHIKFFKLF